MVKSLHNIAPPQNIQHTYNVEWRNIVLPQNHQVIMHYLKCVTPYILTVTYNYLQYNLSPFL